MVYGKIFENGDKELFIIINNIQRSQLFVELNDQAERNEFHIIDNIGDYDENEIENILFLIIINIQNANAL